MPGVVCFVEAVLVVAFLVVDVELDVFVVVVLELVDVLLVVGAVK